jgi:hypothetical protein
MNKIVQVALNATFKPEQVNALIEIINATPNPVMATELLLGIYEEPVLLDVINDKGIIKTLTSVNHWENNVRYSYDEEKIIRLYVLSDQDVAEVNLENYKQFEQRWDTDIDLKSVQLPTGEIKQCSGNCNVSNWQRVTGPIDNEYALTV